MGYADNAEAAYPIRAVGRVCDVLDALNNAPDGASLTLVAEQTGLPKSSALRYLTTLEARKYVERDTDNGRYRIGLALRPDPKRYLDAIREAVRPQLAVLGERFGETVSLHVLDHSEVTVVEVAESAHPIRLVLNTGERSPLHTTAAGKAIATQLSEHRLCEILDQSGMPPRTEKSITAAEEFLNDVRQATKRGYGSEDSENYVGARAISVPLIDLPLLAAISLSGPSTRFTSKEATSVAVAFKKSVAEIASQLRRI